MPASFAADLCGFRSDGKPNTADATEKHSVMMGRALFERIGVPDDRLEPKGVGALFDRLVTVDLAERLVGSASHLTVLANRPIHEFEQYSHLHAVAELSKRRGELDDALQKLKNRTGSLSPTPDSALENAVANVLDAAAAEQVRQRALLDVIGNDAGLQLDVTVHRELDLEAGASAARHLVCGLSLKWSLRTDRLQDPLSQAVRMATLRRGRMPHIAAITMEPRPYMLKLLASGTGNLDCVYHLNLPALSDAVEEVCATAGQRRNRDDFHRLVAQRRIRDYDDLVAYLGTL